MSRWPAFTEEGKVGNPIVQTKDSDAKLRIMTNYMIDNPDANQDEMIQAALEEGWRFKAWITPSTNTTK